MSPGWINVAAVVTLTIAMIVDGLVHKGVDYSLLALLVLNIICAYIQFSRPLPHWQ